MTESSRVELKEDLQWLELSNARDLLYLIRRVRATHIARQSGNPVMDKERVRMIWANMRMQSNENSYEFRKRIEYHQLQMSSVGLGDKILLAKYETAHKVSPLIRFPK